MSVTESPAAPSRSARRARVAVAVVFLTNGALFANVVPRYPQLKVELAMSNTVLGAVVAAMPLGALTGGLLAPAAIRRFRSSRVSTLGIVVFAALTMLVAVAPTWFALAAVMFVLGGLDAVIDVAQNAHGLRVQRVYGRSIVNAFHGLWSVGAVLGGLMGSAAAGLRLPLPVHLGCSALLFGAVALVALRFMLPGPEDAERPTRPGTVTSRSVRGAAVRMLAVLSVLAICGAVVEDAGASWGALFLTDLNASAATAGLAFVCLQTAMTVGRLTGDRVIDRWGQRAVVQVGGVLTAVGMGVALAFPSVGTVLAGFALAGLGVATLIPVAMHAADELPGLPAGLGLTVVSWLLRVGSLVSPPLVGVVADLASLRVGLVGVVLAGLVTVGLGSVLARSKS
ncbi:MFS transporter [Actinophytocola xinjiangensis]|uniref:MFS transporter n=1 Tax=Actinophytocola xinjiangensis TaxID=485602 RepID=A0A7Z1B075_9PSEU|nr:MFS transporter [Actinophytocola xinjiangensis]OLF14319.1 MFS transporter [Actinophytocola xinjiangensis]